MISILFDLDGTLVDSSDGIFNAFRYAFKQMNIELLDDNDMRSFIGPPLEVTFQQLFDKQDDIETAISYFRDYYQRKGVYEVTVYLGIVESLQRLVDSGHRLFVTTSKHEPMAKQMLEKLNLSLYFTNIYGSTDKRYHKEDVIKACIMDNQLLKENTYIVGDTLFDMIGGQKMGIKTIGVTWGFGTINELIKNGADYIYHTPSELKMIDNLLSKNH